MGAAEYTDCTYWCYIKACWQGESVQTEEHREYGVSALSKNFISASWLHNKATLHGSCKSTPLPHWRPPPLLLLHSSQPPFCFLSFDLFTAEPAFQCSFNPSSVHSLDPHSSHPTHYFSYQIAFPGLFHPCKPPRQQSGSDWDTVLGVTFGVGI